jgi:hypothetical protein
MGIGAQPEPQRRLVGAVAAVFGADPGEALSLLDAGWA